MCVCDTLIAIIRTLESKRSNYFLIIVVKRVTKDELKVISSNATSEFKNLYLKRY